MSARFDLSLEAAADLREIADYIAEDDAAAARKFVRRLRETMQKIAEFPAMGHLRDDLASQPLRFWPVGRYVIVYRQAGEQPVEIVRVLHGARDLAALLSTD